MNNLIPTRYKEKLPQKWSYFLGAEIISKELSTIDFKIDIDLAFKWRGEYWHSKFQQKVKESKEILIFRCYDSLLNDGLTVYIHAVPSEIKNDVQQTFISEILPKFSKWLSEEQQGKSFNVYLNLKDKNLFIK